MTDTPSGNGFYVSSGLGNHYSYHQIGSIPQPGDEFKGVDQPFSIEYFFTVFAIDNEVDGNKEGLVGIVDQTPMEKFAFKEPDGVSPKTVHDFYEALKGASEFDFSRRYASTAPEHLKEYLDRLIWRADMRLGAYASDDIFERVHEEADIDSTEISEQVVEFPFEGRNITLKKLMLKLVSQGTARYSHNAYDELAPSRS